MDNNYILIDGKKVRDKILDELKECVSKLDKKPSFVVIQVGNVEASNVYIKQKEKMAMYVGYEFRHINFPDNVTQDELVDKIDELNKDNDVNGILVQMPLPNHIDINAIQNAVLPEKDIDGLNDVNAGLLFHDKDALYSCTPFGVMKLLKEYNIKIEGAHAVVVGRSNLVGKPMAMMLLNAGATVTICHSKTKDLAKYTRDADILVVGVGKPNFITGDMIKENGVVIDVGINRLDSGLCGDVSFDEASNNASYITPVPGGVGPMTVAVLGENVLRAYKIQNGIK